MSIHKMGKRAGAMALSFCPAIIHRREAEAVLNRVILIGRTTAQPEMRVTPNGTQVTTFTLAVDRPTDVGQDVDYLDVVAFGKLAENVAQYVVKGHQLAVEGRLQTRVYETKEGQKRKVYEVIAENVQFLSKPKSE